MIGKGSWVVGTSEAGTWTNPGKVTCVNDAFIIFELYEPDGTSYETHREHGSVRLARKEDFDRAILLASKMSVDIESFIGQMYDIQKTIKY